MLKKIAADTNLGIEKKGLDVLTIIYLMFHIYKMI